MTRLTQISFIGALIVVLLSSCTMLTDSGSSAAELTRDGWEFFSNGYYRSALQSFEDALGKRENYPPALLGKGWTHLMRSKNNEASSIR